MNHSVGTYAKSLILLLLIAIAAAATGCGGDTTGRSSMPSEAVTLPKKYDVPPGADPSVPAELGGAGFEAIAADSGWQTSTIAPAELRYITDTNATKGGEITLALPEFPATFRAYGKDENTAPTRLIYGLVYETLLNINPLNLDFMPGLATHWKVGEDNQTYYFRIDPNARFSDGHRVTSEDVIATYNLGLDSTILEPYTNSFFASFDPPEAVSMYIVKIRSKENAWKNMFYFAGRVIMPAHVIGNISGREYLEKFQYNMPPGTGPYVVLEQDVKKGQTIAATRRTDWWGEQYDVNKGQYNFDKIRFIIIRDENLELEKFKNGDYDFYQLRRASYWVEKFNIDERERGLIQMRKVYNANPVGFGGIAFNTNRAPFNDPNMRRVFTLLFNRAQIVEKLMYNEYDLSSSIYPASIYENPNNPKQEFNPEKAAALLTEMGYTTRNNDGILMKNGKPLEVEMLINEAFVRVITPYQQVLKQAGIKLNLRVVDDVTKFTMTTEKNYTVTFQQWGGIIYPNPISSFHSKLAKEPNTNNVTGFANPRADELIDLEQVTFDPTKRVKILRAIDSIFVASNHYALAYHVPYVRLVYWNKFGMPDFIIGRIVDWRGVAQYWWFDPEMAATVAKARRDKSIKMDTGQTVNRFWQEYDKTHQPDISGAGL